jgi:hypothetical protein
MNMDSGLARRRPIGIVGMVAVTLCLAPNAFGAAPWSAPQVVPGAYQARWASVTTPGGPGLSGYALKTVDGLLGFTPGGAGVAVLGREAGGMGLARFSAATGTFGSLRQSAFAGIAPSRMALFGREGVMLAGQANKARDPRSRLNAETFLDAAVTRGTVSGGFAQRQVLANGVFRGSAGPATVTALAANTAGDAAAVVSVPVAGRTTIAGYQSRLLVRRRGQASFRNVTDIGVRTVGRSPAALAVNTPGDVLVAWDDRTSVRALLVRANGQLATEQRLGQGGSAYYGGERLVAAMDGTRRMLVAWMAQRIGEGSYAGSPGTVALAYASPYKPFRPAQVVQHGLPTGDLRGITGHAVQAALLRNRGVVAWTGYASGRYAVRTVDVTSGRAGSVRDLSPAGAGARLQGLSVGPRGGAVLVFVTGARRSNPNPRPPLSLSAVTRAADATAWSPIEHVATADAQQQDFIASDALIAADPVSGQGVLVWSDPLQAPPSPVPVNSSVRPAG